MYYTTIQYNYKSVFSSFNSLKSKSTLFFFILYSSFFIFFILYCLFFIIAMTKIHLKSHSSAIINNYLFFYKSPQAPLPSLPRNRSFIAVFISGRIYCAFMVCKVTAKRDSRPPPCPPSSTSLYDAKKGRQLGASHIRLSRIRPVCVRPCVWRKQKQKSHMLVEPETESGRQAGAKNMLMSIILCVICFHASSVHPLWLPPPISRLLPLHSLFMVLSLWIFIFIFAQCLR